MTLIVSLANPRFTIQLSDRRLTSKLVGSKTCQVLTDEANKAGTLTCHDARLAYGFSGLATDWPNRRFSTRNWLQQALLEAAPPDFKIEFIAQRFSKIATREFCQNPIILGFEKSKRKLSVILTGFWNTNYGCIPAGWIVTNYQKRFDLFDVATDDTEPWEHFRVWRWHPRVPWNGSYVHIERVGEWNRVPHGGLLRLRQLLREGRPEDAIIGSALKVMHAASDFDDGKGSIGKQVSVIVIPSDVREAIRYSSESNVITNAVFSPDTLIAAGTTLCMMMELKHVPTSEFPGPGSVPRVHRKAPCPCGSGKTYERCHRLYRGDIRLSRQLT